MFNKWKISVCIDKTNLSKKFVKNVENKLKSIVNISAVDVNKINKYDVVITGVGIYGKQENKLVIEVGKQNARKESVNYRIFDPYRNNTNLDNEGELFTKYFIALLEELKIPFFSETTSSELL